MKHHFYLNTSKPAMTAVPSIACLGVIGKNVHISPSRYLLHSRYTEADQINPQNNPLHISIFPSQPSNKPLRTPLQFSLILSSTLDIFEARSKANISSGVGLSGDFGLLHAIDERLAAYGFETNTGVRFVAIVDMRGRIVSDEAARGQVTGLRDGEMKLVSASSTSSLLKDGGSC